MDPAAVPERTSSMGVVPLRRKYTSLMLSATQTTLTEKSRDVSAASDMSNLSVDSSVSDFLERKIRLHRASVEYFREYKNGLLQLRSSNQLGEKDFCAEMGDAEKEILPAAEELKVLRRQRRTLASDMEESCEDSITEPKRPNLALEPSFEFLERAYTSTMVSRVMASSKQKRSRFNQAQFRKDVIKYLNADPDPENSGRIWCHLDGWLISKYVKAAHLVPKSLRGEEVAFLFGGDDLELANPRNGITLRHTVEEALDSGAIVIVPVPPSLKSEVTKWKCILVDEGRRGHVYASEGDTIRRWEGLDGKELRFLSNNRPARRYLYFRYVITYLNAKRDGNKSWVDKIDGRHVFWASPGPYLEKSTLISLGRSISGFELPEALYKGNTFNGEPGLDTTEGQEILLSSRLRDAIIESAKGPTDTDDEEDED